MTRHVRPFSLIAALAICALVAACNSSDFFGVLAAPNIDSSTDNNPYVTGDSYAIFIDRRNDSVTLTFGAEVAAAELAQYIDWETSNGEPVPFSVSGVGAVHQVTPENGWSLACSGSTGSAGNCGTITISGSLKSTSGASFDPDGDGTAGPAAIFILGTLT